MKQRLRIQGLRKRWLLNIAGPLVAVLLIVGVFGCIETTSRFTSANTLFDFFIAERGAQAP